MTSPREALRAAIEAHGAAVEAVKSSEETLTRARSFVADLESQMRDFADVDARVASERASAIRNAMASGEAPVFEVSAATKVAVAVRDAHEKHLATAQEAVEALQSERDAAVKAAERTSLELEWAAERVMAATADELAHEYNVKLAEVRSLYLTLWGISTMQVRRATHEVNRINQSPVRALVLPSSAAIAVRDEDVKIETPTTRRDVYRKVIRDSVLQWLGELKEDPDAELSVPLEGLCKFVEAA